MKAQKILLKKNLVNSAYCENICYKIFHLFSSFLYLILICDIIPLACLFNRKSWQRMHTNEYFNDSDLGLRQ